METTTVIEAEKQFPFASKFKIHLERKFADKVISFNFKSHENNFANPENGQVIEQLKKFHILTVLERFFYTDENRFTHISNVIVDRSEPVAFYSEKKLSTLRGKTEFSFEELNDLTFDQSSGINRKIILVGIYEGKLTKIEAQATSERSVLSYLESSGDENTVDVSGVNRQYKDRNSGILSLRKSEEQLALTKEDEEMFYSRLQGHVNSINANIQKPQEVAKAEVPEQIAVAPINTSFVPNFDFSLSSSVQ